MSEFDDINGFDGWRKKLDELLGEARSAAESNDETALLAVADRLTQFTIESWPDTTEIKALDQVAGDTATRLRKQGIEGKLDAIAARTAEVEKLAKDFDQAAQVNTDKADSIRLKRVREVIDTATSAVTTLTRFRDTLKSGDDAALIAEVNTILAGLDSLRKRVDKT
jgi:hypothetical protein